jgi:hypothetical protein
LVVTSLRAIFCSIAFTHNDQTWSLCFANCQSMVLPLKYELSWSNRIKKQVICYWGPRVSLMLMLVNECAFLRRSSRLAHCLGFKCYLLQFFTLSINVTIIVAHIALSGKHACSCLMHFQFTNPSFEILVKFP